MNMRKPIKELFDKIEKLTIKKGIISTDITIYEFKLKKDNSYSNFSVDSDKLDTMKEFRKQYQKVMNYPCVRCTNVEWDNLLFALIKKWELTETSEESETVFKAREIFAEICELDVSTDPTDAVTGYSLYEYNDYYYLTSKKVRDIIETRNYRIPLNTLSTAMTELGLKKEGTEAIRFYGKQVRCWVFFPAKVKELKQEEK